MLFLIFGLGDDRYALEAGSVVEVLPRLEVKKIPHAAAGLCGVFNYHGTPVPLIDLSELALRQPCQAWMSTRIIVVNYLGEAGETHLLGLLAEQACETLRRLSGEFRDSGVTVHDAPYLGPVTIEDGRPIQLVEIEHLLTVETRRQLFQTSLELA